MVGRKLVYIALIVFAVLWIWLFMITMDMDYADMHQTKSFSESHLIVDKGEIKNANVKHPRRKRNHHPGKDGELPPAPIIRQEDENPEDQSNLIQENFKDEDHDPWGPNETIIKTSSTVTETTKGHDPWGLNDIVLEDISIKDKIQENHSNDETNQEQESQEPIIIPTTCGAKGITNTGIHVSQKKIQWKHNGVHVDDASDKLPRYHGWLGYKDEKPLWEPTPLKKPLSQFTFDEKKEAHTQTAFNVVVSNSLPLDRPFGDYRDKRCEKFYENKNELGRGSVVITFFQEALSPLIRSIHSILNTAHNEHIKEIILIDDGSDLKATPWLGKSFEEYLMNLPKVKFFRLPHRMGLMQARLAGMCVAQHDKEDKEIRLIFLDSHIECNVGWVEPLLNHITEDYKNVGVPLIDGIDHDSFIGSSGGISVLGHSWTLGQQFLSVPVDGLKPTDSPIMAGGLFMISERWFEEIGRYDKEFREYGGEEMEIGLKIWMCGGQLEVIPCSRIGHVFRKNTYWKGQVYKVDGGNIVRNKARVVEVWLDEPYKKIAKLAMGTLDADHPLGSVEEQKKHRKEVCIHDYKWFHENIYPQLKVPNLEGAQFGALQSQKMNACLDTLGASSNSDEVGTYSCHWQHGSQAFILTGDGAIQVAVSGFEKCISVDSGRLMIQNCRKSDKWKFELVSGTQGLMKYDDDCLQIKKEQTPKSGFRAILAPCDRNDENFLWNWVEPGKEPKH